jgi:glucose-1-phosphate thymidylyltransferase
MPHLIIPMAGKGKRLLPHTLTTPKPFLPIAGKPIIGRLVQTIQTYCQEPITHIGFIVKDLMPTAKQQLEAIAATAGAQPHFYEQAEALGTAHAIACAAPLLKGPVMIAFADTLFSCSRPFDLSKQNIIWIHPVSDPSAFGVVALGPHNTVTHFVEKPTQFVSDWAIIGVYYFQEGEALYQSIQTFIAESIPSGEEYQLTTVLTRMQQQGFPFHAQPVKEWLDCGNKTALLHTNERFLHILQHQEPLIDATAYIENSTILPPAYIGPDVSIHNSVLGPNVSIGSRTAIIRSCIRDSIIQDSAHIEACNLRNSIIGSYTRIQGKATEINVGSYNTLLL